jgi:DNA-binding GntR family transcriptional regulator
LVPSKLGEDQIYTILRNAIFNAELPPGTQLIESSLAMAFDVSRTPIRSVLQRLKYEWLVQVIPNRGSFVYCPTPREAEEIFHVRGLLEPEAVRLAAERITPWELDKLEALLEEESQCYIRNEPHQALQVIDEFHKTMIKASKNNYLIRCLEETLSLSHIILTFYDVSGANNSHTFKEHQDILQALRDKDADQAKNLAHQHIPSIMGDIDFSKSFNRALSIEQIITRYTP